MRFRRSDCYCKRNNAKGFCRHSRSRTSFSRRCGVFNVVQKCGRQNKPFRMFGRAWKAYAEMPGAMCGHWGICGSVASVGAALSIINGTGPLSTDDHYKHNMEYAASVLSEMSKIGGARCCKRNAFLSVSRAVEFVNDKYGMKIKLGNIRCEFSRLNKQCLKNKCPFYKI